MSNESPETYRTTIDQTTGYHESGAPYTRLIDVVTDGSDYLGGQDWDEMTEEEREDLDDWVWRLHLQTVRLAEMDPEVRESYQGCKDDPDEMESDLDAHVEEEVAS